MSFYVYTHEFCVKYYNSNGNSAANSTNYQGVKSKGTGRTFNEVACHLPQVLIRMHSGTKLIPFYFCSMTVTPNNLPAAFFKLVQSQAKRPLYSQFIRGDSHDENFALLERSYLDVAKRVCAIATFLKTVGVGPGDSVGIISASRPEWLEADLAIMAVGGIVVSLYPSLVEAEVAYILHDSKAKYIFVENIEQLEKVLKIANRLNPMPATEDYEASEQLVSINQIITFESTHKNPLVTSLEIILENQIEVTEFDHSLYNSTQCGSVASIVYTSGTTGPQKGVMQTHSNHLANIRQAAEGRLYKEDSAIFMLLPLAHSFAKLMGYIGFIGGVPLQFPSISDSKTSRANQRRTLLDLSSCTCGVIPLVPRILEKMKEGVEQQASKTGLKGFLLKLTLLSAKENSKQSPTLPMRALFLLTAPLRKAIKKKLFGSSFQYVISGGAKLSPEVNQFFAILKIEVLEGYGLTETCVATNCNRPGSNKIGTVGPLLASDIELKFAEDGEIMFRGPNIAKGYCNQPSATAKAWDSEGWFHTGDLGSLDADGYLTISGRKKEILVTSGGKKISPDRIESLLKKHELLSQAILVGEARSYCVALVTANREQLQLMLSQFAVTSVDELMAHPNIILKLGHHLDSINSELASYESIKRVYLLKNDFSVENGFLTPTLKMRRNPILKHYSEEIESLYNSSEKVLVESE